MRRSDRRHSITPGRPGDGTGSPDPWGALDRTATAVRYVLISGVAATAVGLTYHFGGKEDLLREAALATLGRMFAVPQQILTTAASLPELIDGMLTWSTADDAGEEGRIVLLEAMTQSRRDPVLSEALARALTGYRTAVAAAFIRLTETPRAFTSAAADSFAAHCDGLWLHAIIDPDFPTIAARDETTRLWRAAVSS